MMEEVECICPNTHMTREGEQNIWRCAVCGIVETYEGVTTVIAYTSIHYKPGQAPMEESMAVGFVTGKSQMIEYTNYVRRALVYAGLLFTEEDIEMILATASPFSLDLCRLIASSPITTVHSLMEAKQVMRTLLDEARKDKT